MRNYYVYKGKVLDYRDKLIFKIIKEEDKGTYSVINKNSQYDIESEELMGLRKFLLINIVIIATCLILIFSLIFNIFRHDLLLFLTDLSLSNTELLKLYLLVFKLGITLILSIFSIASILNIIRSLIKFIECDC